MKLFLKIILFPIAIISLLLGLAIASIGGVLKLFTRIVLFVLSLLTLFSFYNFFFKAEDLGSAVVMLILLMAAVGIELLIDFAPDLFLKFYNFVIEP